MARQPLIAEPPVAEPPVAAVRGVPLPIDEAGSAKVALVHDWCPAFRGGERVAARLAGLLNVRNVYTLFDFLPDAVKSEHFRDLTFHTSVANGLPGIERYYRALFFACPFLIEQFDVTAYDVVVSSSAAFARGVLTRPEQPHLCYVHSPARYAWDEQFSYLGQAKLGYGPLGLPIRYMLHGLRTWDTRTAHGPDLMLANSRYVQSRIRRIYGRDARVVHPPVPTDDIPFVDAKDDYFVTASFLVPYKRVDLVVRAFNAMPSRRLVVVGEGPDLAALRALAGPNVTFAGHLPRKQFVRVMAEAQAMVFAGCEDFGITMAEAQACGTPLIAFERGGANDIVRTLGSSERPTGLLFREQSEAAIIAAVEHFDECRGRILPEFCATSAARFSVERFDRAILQAFEDVRALNRERLSAPPDLD